MSEDPNSGRKLFYGLFIFPLLIAVCMAILLCAVVLLTHDDETPESLISAIKTGSPSKRWQKAFELSNELNQKKNGIIGNEALLGEIITIFKDKEHYDPKTRGYMAVALSHFSNTRSTKALTDALSDDHAEVLLFSVWSLGTLDAKGSLPQILPLLRSNEKEVRQMSVYVSGVLGNQATIPSILPLLNDPVADVRWNAALALARLGSDAGFEVLEKMLDRKTFATDSPPAEEAIEQIMINAVRGLALIRKPESIKILETVSRSESNLKVRQAALDALAQLKKR